MRTENYIKNPLIDIRIRQKRASLVTELQNKIREIDNPEDFKYISNIYEIKTILDELEELREKELDALRTK